MIIVFVFDFYIKLMFLGIQLDRKKRAGASARTDRKVNSERNSMKVRNMCCPLLHLSTNLKVRPSCKVGCT